VGALLESVAAVGGNETMNRITMVIVALSVSGCKIIPPPPVCSHLSCSLHTRVCSNGGVVGMTAPAVNIETDFMRYQMTKLHEVMWAWTLQSPDDEYIAWQFADEWSATFCISGSHPMSEMESVIIGLRHQGVAVEKRNGTYYIRHVPAK
jgi:hypothetical protein